MTRAAVIVLNFWNKIHSKMLFELAFRYLYEQLRVANENFKS